MSWTTPVDQVTGFLVTAAIYNSNLIDNLAYLHGDAGTIALAALLKDTSGFTTGPSSAVYTGSQTAGAFADVTGQFASFCNAAVSAFSAGAISDSVARWTVDSNGNMAWGPGGASALDLTISRKAGAQLKISGAGASNKGNIMGGYAASAPGLPATFTPDAAALVNRCAPINVSGTLTIAAPVNAPSGSESAFFIFILVSPSAGAPTLAWNAIYKGYVGVAPSANSGMVLLMTWDPGTSVWSSISLTTGVAGL